MRRRWSARTSSASCVATASTTTASSSRARSKSPEWFWPAAIEDMGIEFIEPWHEVVDASRGPEWATWFVGGKLNIAWNCVHRWAARARRRDRRRLPRRGRRETRADVRRAVVAGDEARRGARAARRRAGRPRRHLPADVAGGRDRVPRLRAHRRRPGADLLRLRCARGRPEAHRLRGEGRDHRRELAPPRPRDRHARHTRGGAARGARRSSTSSSRRSTSCSPTAPASSSRSPSTPSTRTCSRTRRARPAGRRACSTSRAASSSRSLARSATRPTRVPATSSTSPPTWAGSWARGRSSAAARWARRSSTPRARPTGRPTGSGRLVEEERVIDPRLLADAHPRADPPRRAGARSLVPPRHRHHRGAVEPRPVPLALRQGRRRALPDHQLLGRDRGRRVLPVPHAGDPDQGVLGRRAPLPAWRWTSSTTRAARSSGPARSASSCAASRSRA